MKQLVYSCASALLVVVAGCSSPPAELEAGPAGVARSSLETGRVGGLGSYLHTASASRLAVGRFVETKSELGFSKVVSDEGVISSRKSGMVLGITNAGATARRRPALSMDAEVHNRAVRTYFVGTGLPAEQLDRAEEFPVMQGGGVETGEAVNHSLDTVDYYFSGLSRRTPAGVVVVDSYAWARINVDGDVVMEGVYWPEIPGNVVDEAERLQASLRDESSKTAFLAKLPQRDDKAYEGGRVVIRHSSGAWDGAFAVRASFDVTSGNRVLHFDSSGRLFELASESKESYSFPKHVKQVKR